MAPVESMPTKLSRWQMWLWPAWQAGQWPHQASGMTVTDFMDHPRLEREANLFVGAFEQATHLDG